MATQTKTIQEINTLLSLIHQISVEPNDKLSYAIKKNKNILQKLIADDATLLNEKQDDLKIKYASVDDKGNLLTDNGQYKFSQENYKKFLAESAIENKHFLAKKIIFEPYFYTPEDNDRYSSMDLFLREELTGFLFAPEIKK